MRRRVTQIGFLAPAAAYVVLFFAYPLAQNLMMSFQDITVAAFVTGEAPWIGFDNYTQVVGDAVFSTAAVNTVVFVAGSLLFQFMIGLALAVFFAKSFPLGGLLRSLLLVPWLLPLIVSGTVFRWMLDTDNGVLNQFLLLSGVIDRPVQWLTSTSMAMIGVLICNVWIGIPFNLVILYGGLQNIPTQLYEAASIDGAGAWTRFRRITLPLLRPVIAVVLMLGLIYTIKVFDVIMVLTQGGPANATHTLTTYSYHLSFTILDFGQGAAVGNMLIVVALVFAVFYLRSTRVDREAH